MFASLTAGSGLLLAVFAILINTNLLVYNAEAITAEEAAALLGGDSNMCVVTLSCATVCTLDGEDCSACDGSQFKMCKLNPGTSCTQTYNAINPLYCGFVWTGPPIGGECIAAACKNLTNVACGLIPNTVTGDACP